MFIFLNVNTYLPDLEPPVDQLNKQISRFRWFTVFPCDNGRRYGTTQGYEGSGVSWGAASNGSDGSVPQTLDC